MKYKNNYFSNKKLSAQHGMTLVEILVSLLILGLIVMATYPLFTQSLRTSNLSHSLANSLFGGQRDIEIVAATKTGVLFEDGSFLPDKYFPVFFSGDNDFTPVPGITVKKNNLVRFLASIPHIKTTYLYEGYAPEEAIITIKGNRTHFIEGSTKITVKNNNDENVDVELNITSETEAKVTLPVDADNKLINKFSPYTITLKTGNEIVSTLLPVHLPKCVAIGDNSTVLVSSNGKHWDVKDVDNITAKIKAAAHNLENENNGAFLAVGEDGYIYIWENAKDWSLVDQKLTANNLNDVIFANHRYVVVGDKGTILTSLNGKEWNLCPAGTDQNLYSIAFNTALSKFVAVGEGGIILTSTDSIDWTQQHTWPLLNQKNGKNVVSFSGEGEYLTTDYAPIIGSRERTIFMVITIDDNDNTLLTWGYPTAGYTFSSIRSFSPEAYHLRIDQGNNDDTYAKASFNVPESDFCIVGLRAVESEDSLRVADHVFYVNSDIEPDSNNDSTEIDTQNFTWPAQIGNNTLTGYNNLRPFKGNIAEILIYDTALDDDRELIEGSEDEYYASDIDKLRAYLINKYTNDINSLYGEGGYVNLSNLIIEDSGDNLSYTDKDIVPTDNLILWLDAQELGIEKDEQVLIWEDISPEDNHYNYSVSPPEPLNHNHARGRDLLTVVSSDSGFLSLGDYRVALKSEDSTNWTSNNTLTRYIFADAVWDNNRYVVIANNYLLDDNPNDDPDVKDGIILTSNNGDTFTEQTSPTDKKLNDIACNSAADSENPRFIAVGNNGTIIISKDGNTWEEISLADVSQNLRTVTMR